MSSKMSRQAYEKMIAEDIAWLDAQPRTLERDHIRAVLEASIAHEYPDHEPSPDAAAKHADVDALARQRQGPQPTSDTGVPKIVQEYTTAYDERLEAKGQGWTDSENGRERMTAAMKRLDAASTELRAFALHSLVNGATKGDAHDSRSQT